jgi:hypothetical protein
VSTHPHRSVRTGGIDKRGWTRLLDYNLVLNAAIDIKPQNILVETPAINRMFEQAPSEAFQSNRPSLEPPNDFYMASTQVSSAEEDISNPSELSIRLADFGTCKALDLLEKNQRT